MPNPMPKSMPMRVLFVCSRNQWRSPTAERVFRKHGGLTVRSRGLAKSAKRALQASDVRWAELILVMEESHLDRLYERFGEALGTTPVYSLDIPDDYRFMDPALVELLEVAVPPLIDMTQKTDTSSAP